MKAFGRRQTSVNVTIGLISSTMRMSVVMKDVVDAVAAGEPERRWSRG